MAITHSRDLQSVQVFEVKRELIVQYRDTFEDQDDPNVEAIMTVSRKAFAKGDDLTNEHPLVQSLAAAAWAE